MAKIVNLTPHDVVIVTASEKLTFSASGTVARCKSASVPVSTIETEAGAVSLVKTVIGEPENVPEAEEGTLYIVSRLIKSALPERDDLVCPDGLVRDENGNVIGAERFSL